MQTKSNIKTKEKCYAIIDNEGNYKTYKTYGSYDNFHIPLFSKDGALKEIDLYFKNEGYSVKKVKIK